MRGVEGGLEGGEWRRKGGDVSVKLRGMPREAETWIFVKKTVRRKRGEPRTRPWRAAYLGNGPPLLSVLLSCSGYIQTCAIQPVGVTEQ